MVGFTVRDRGGVITTMFTGMYTFVFFKMLSLKLYFYYTTTKRTKRSRRARDI